MKKAKLPTEVLDNLEDLIQTFEYSLDIEETLDLTLKKLMEHMHCEAASIFLTNDGDKLTCMANAGPVDIKGYTIDKDTGIIGKAIEESEIQMIMDTRESNQFFEGVDDKTGFQTRSILCVPLIVHKEILGAIELINKLPSKKNPDGLFSEVDKHLLSILASSAALAIRNSRMASELVQSEMVQQELEIARTIQESFLPVYTEEHPIAGINLAAKNVSGDFFDYFLQPDGTYVFNIGDVSGKGMDAALLMAKASSLYHCLGKTIKSPGKIMEVINEELVEHTTRGMFITMVGGIYNPITRSVTLSNAGHLPVIQRTSEGKFLQYDSRTLPLGIMPDQVLEEVTFSLAGSSLYLYTDGLSEGLARTLDKPDELQNLHTLIDRFCDVPRQERLRQLAEEASRFDAGFDDLTILLIEDSHGAKSEILAAQQ
ncbi:MAG: SpoIIE family protein phosphatase [Gammaproteobacteria bacterium]|nr:SpoIIE family protein phosphatase [Gammaproteobacteria bacterium]